MIVFRILSGGKEGKIIKSDLDLIYAGRKPECILQLDPYQDLSVHGQHAKIYKSGGFYYLEDLNSKNGTFVNDQPIKVPIQLKQNLKFRLGNDGPEIEVYDCKVDVLESTPKTENTFLLKRLDTETVFNFEQKSVRLGRQPDCELALDPLKNREVSGYHALICCRDEGYYLEDLQSANGTFLNGVICKNSELKNLDIIQLGKEGPKFQFLYRSQLVHQEPAINQIPSIPVPAPLVDVSNTPIIETEESVVESVVESAEEQVVKKKIAKKPPKKVSPPKKELLNTVKKQWNKQLEVIKTSNVYKKALSSIKTYKKESIIIGITLFFIVVLLVFLSSSTYNKESLYIKYNQTVVPIYSRYLVRINGKMIRGQVYSSGVVYHKNGKTNIIALRDNIFPWENKQQPNDDVQKLVHIVAVWPHEVPTFDDSVGYNALDFSQSYNNDHIRVGGKEIFAMKIKDKVTCKLVIDGVIPFAMPQEEVLINPTKIKQKTKVFCIYTSPDEGILDNGTLAKTITEGTVQNTVLMIDCKSQGAPIFNKYGEIIGVYLNQSLTPINY